jgi:ABC-type Na+ efflux pump permease subunit
VIDVQELQKEWPIISGAPWLFAAAVVAAGVLIWLFLLIIFRSQISGLKEQISGLKEQIASLKEQIGIAEQRLKLADDLVEAANRAREEVDKQLQDYKAEVAAKGRNASPAKVEAAFEQLKKEDAALVEHALTLAHRRREEADARARGSLPRGSGYPSVKVPGLTLNSNPWDNKL